VPSSFMVNGLRQTSKSSGKLRPTMDAAFVRHAGQGSLKFIPNLLRIRIGSLDEAPSTIGPPQRENWTKRREPWLSPIASAEQAKEDARDANGSQS
jgi:hypothetical protein